MNDHKLLMTTQDCFADYDIKQTLGLVRGNTVRSRNIGRNLLAGIRTVFGGEISEWTKAVAESREQALDRLTDHAKEKGADAVVAIRFVSTEMGKSASEIMVYGTAVTLKSK